MVTVKLIYANGDVNLLAEFETKEEALLFSQEEVLRFDGDFYRNDSRTLELYVDDEETDEIVMYQLLYTIRQFRRADYSCALDFFQKEYRRSLQLSKSYGESMAISMAHRRIWQELQHRETLRYNYNLNEII